MTKNIRPDFAEYLDETPETHGISEFFSLADDKFFHIDWGKGIGWDLKGNKLFEFSEDAGDITAFVCMFDGVYIMRKDFYDQAENRMKQEYIRLTEAELIKR